MAQDNHDVRPRRRRSDEPQPLATSPCNQREKKVPGGPERRSPVKIRHTKQRSHDLVRPPRTALIERPSTSTRSSVEDNLDARHFTVTNVGAGGTLYLKPSRVTSPTRSKPPATLQTIADAREGTTTTEIYTAPVFDNVDDESGTWTPRPDLSTLGAEDYVLSKAPAVQAPDSRPRGRPRSFSSSDVGGNARRRPSALPSTEFRLLINGQIASGRPKSSLDLSRGLLDLHIPHYRLGTPRFSTMGTPYLHNSIYSATSDDLRSSVFSRAEFDKLFPAPPGDSHSSATSQRLHPAYRSSRIPSLAALPITNAIENMDPSMFNGIEARAHDPMMVRYCPRTGRILAATRGRLVSQITSPVFLDYELLSDFFLTFRCFMSQGDLLTYLLNRMKWALGNDTDTGRIVRVRTFVALRHWILNYFSDDFVPDFQFRQTFCIALNSLVATVKQRAPPGSTDLSVLSELKKCWRRTCSLFWPSMAAVTAPLDTDIVPGERMPLPDPNAPTLLLPPPDPMLSSGLDFRRSSQIILPQQPYAGEIGPVDLYGRAKTASIPTSPMSEDSVEILSCSVPFLRTLRCTVVQKDKKIRPMTDHKRPQLTARQRIEAHKRSYSHPDTLQDDGRHSQRSTRRGQEEAYVTMPNTFTGGLVRGLLLQPPPSNVEASLLPFPTHDRTNRALPEHGRSSLERQHNVKRVVGDVYRALSGKKDSRECPMSSSRSSAASSTRSNRNHTYRIEGSDDDVRDGQVYRVSRTDMLAQKVEEAYNKVFNRPPHSTVTQPQQSNVDQDAPARPLDDTAPAPEVRFRGAQSHVTASSRSILIMDDTRQFHAITDFTEPMPPMPTMHQGTSGSREHDLRQSPKTRHVLRSEPILGTVANQNYPDRSSSDPALHDLLVDSESWAEFDNGLNIAHNHSNARKSSSAFPSELDVPTTMKSQLRRRPGGDLKAADHVHDLQSAPGLSHNSEAFMDGLVGASYNGDGEVYSQNFGCDEPKLSEESTQDVKHDSWELLSTQSMAFDMRPSMKAEVSRLAALPDGPMSGGIEDALARLEGKTLATNQEANVWLPKRVSSLSAQNTGHAHQRFGSIGSTMAAHNDMENPGSQTPQSGIQGANMHRVSQANTDSPGRTGRDTMETSPKSGVASPTPSNRARAIYPPQSTNVDDLPRDSIIGAGIIGMNNGSSRNTRSGAQPTSETSQASFLLDDDESLSDISTDIADRSDDEQAPGVQSFYFDDTANGDAWPLPLFNTPPTPPPTAALTIDRSPPQSQPPPQRPASDSHRDKATSDHIESVNGGPSLTMPRPVTAPPPPPLPLPGHLSFVLAFETHVIAEQLTIIEKDALDEVEWKDLILLNWQQSPLKVLNWVDYLKDGTKCSGIDIVIARFNLVVKWVVSQCVMTQSAIERAQCLVKFIHIAAHAQRLHNYATMYQITLALLSADISRLRRTWALVPMSDRQTLARLEALCQPLRNFQRLRAEMDALDECQMGDNPDIPSASSTTSSPCIPFIGLYTHDLMFNAQKPAQLNPPQPASEPLVNFERCQTAAGIVKGLLRLIEASSNYVFRPVPEVLSRCLWLAALDDWEIAARSRALEP